MSNSYTSLSSLYVHQFRPFEEARFEFGSGLNVICGPNARGKTSILEAIHFLMSGHSFRTSRLPDMIRAGSHYFHLEASYQRHGVHHQLKVTCSDKERHIVNNSTLCNNLSALPGILPGVIMTPEDIAIIKGAPQDRRNFLDAQISQVDPLYLHHLYRYQRAMRQRNAMLKLRQTGAIESWEHEMAHAGAYLIQSREEAINEMQTVLQDYYAHFGSPAEELAINYTTIECDRKSIDELRKVLLSQYEKLRKRELEFGSTLTGPHRDDLTITLSGKEARFFASEGQQRTCVAALRCAEWERINLQVGEKPLMLIDDACMGLDGERQGKLIAYLANLGQVFLTTTSNNIAADYPYQHLHTLTL